LAQAALCLARCQMSASGAPHDTAMASLGQDIKRSFESWDKNGTGKISREDLSALLAKLGSFKETEVDLLVNDLHFAGKNEICYHDFIDALLYRRRSLSLPKAVASIGGVTAWNTLNDDVALLSRTLDGMCHATTVEEALKEVQSVGSLGHDLWAYLYMRRLYNRNLDVYYGILAARPALLMPTVYTPTVGEACQKFGKMPMYSRGCYLSISDRGNFRQVLEEYACAELEKDESGRDLCDCIVFSDGGRILGLGDLGAWGMGIPIGKLDLYTVCAGVHPRRTIPLIIDAGCHGPEENTDRLIVREHPMYTGLRQPRVTHKSPAGTVVNSAYYGENNIISELMEAATDLFGRSCLLQFEDFNSNDAFPLLAEYREKYLTYNDDIQGTASVAVAALIGALKLRDPSCTDLKSALAQQTFLFHGAGSANIGVMRLLRDEAGVPASSIFVTNSRGLIWRSADGRSGNFRNNEQKEFGQVGEPAVDTKNIVALVEYVKPSCVVGAVGVAPGCFTKPMVEALVRLNSQRPVVFALSNPRSQAEIKAEDAYAWSGGKIIFGSGTWFPPVESNGRTFSPGQVNNVYIFPGVSFGVVCCKAQKIPERFFMAAAEAVAISLDDDDVREDRVVPPRDRIAEVSLNVATAVALCAQEMGIAGTNLGANHAEVKATLAGMRWTPNV